MTKFGSSITRVPWPENARDREHPHVAPRGDSPRNRCWPRFLPLTVRPAAAAGLRRVSDWFNGPPRSTHGSRKDVRRLNRFRSWLHRDLRKYRRTLRIFRSTPCDPSARFRRSFRGHHYRPRSILRGAVAFVVAAARASYPPFAACLGARCGNLRLHLWAQLDAVYW